VAELPTGTVTFLFTDIEGSTKLLLELGDRYPEVLAEHRRVLRDAFAGNGGVEVDTQGDAFFVAFAKASDAVAAAEEGTLGLSESPLKVRMGLHTGEPIVTDEGYVGIDVHRAARIAAAGHGGQILLSQSTFELVRKDRVRDLGEHRLKDLAGTERIYQLGDEIFPPLKSINATNLPLPADPLVGRKKELADVLTLFRREAARLVSLTGPGGVGKTRFAIAAAEELVQDFAQGVWFVDLSSIGSAELVVPTIGAALGANDQLVTYIAGRELLLVLDNFEHLTAAAGDVANLLSSCPALTVLVTTRERLQVGGEREYILRPLSEGPAIELFRQRASATVPEFEGAYDEIAEICRRVDGLPLAIELAAARVKVLPPSELLAQLDQRLPTLTGGRRDVPERQRTLRATIAWSYELLDADERIAFGHVSVFAGFTFEAARQVCGSDLDTIASLVEKSLVRRGEDRRFLMLETIREYGLEQLESRPDAVEIRRNHARYFTKLAEGIADDLGGSLQADRLGELAREYDNIRAALRWSFAGDASDTLLGVRLASSLSRFWWGGVHLSEGRRWLEQALGEQPPLELRVRVIAGLSRLAGRQGDAEAAERFANERLRLSRELGDQGDVALGLINLAINVMERSAFAEAEVLAHEGLDVARQLGDEETIGTALLNLGYIVRSSGDLERAEAIFADALLRSRATGNTVNTALILENIGTTALARREYADAAAVFKESLLLFLELRLLGEIPYCLESLAEASAALGDGKRAATLLAGAESLRVEQGLGLDFADRVAHEHAVAAVSAAVGPTEMQRAMARGGSLSLDGLLDLALARDTRTHSPGTAT
jgi:predicted ATPase